MLGWALAFLVLALVAGAFGFFGVAGLATTIAKILFFVFLALLVLSLVARAARGHAPPARGGHHNDSEPRCLRRRPPATRFPHPSISPWDRGAFVCRWGTRR